MKLIGCMFLGILLGPTIFCQLWAFENIGPLLSFVKTARTLVMAEESSTKPVSLTDAQRRVDTTKKLFAYRMG